MTKSQACAVVYGAVIVLGLLFAGVALTLAWPIFSMPTDGPHVGGKQ
jgi:hypothetical protein